MRHHTAAAAPRWLAAAALCCVVGHGVEAGNGKIVAVPHGNRVPDGAGDCPLGLSQSASSVFRADASQQPTVRRTPLTQRVSCSTNATWNADASQAGAEPCVKSRCAPSQWRSVVRGPCSWEQTHMWLSQSTCGAHGNVERTRVPCWVRGPCSWEQTHIAVRSTRALRQPRAETDTESVRARDRERRRKSAPDRERACAQTRTPVSLTHHGALTLSPTRTGHARTRKPGGRGNATRAPHRPARLHRGPE